MKDLSRWTRDLPLRRKFHLLGAGITVPFLVLILLATATYLSVTGEVTQTLHLGREGDSALANATQIDSFLLVHQSLFRLSNSAANPSGGVSDPSLWAAIRENVKQAEQKRLDLETVLFQPIETAWSAFREDLIETLPRILKDKHETQLKFDDAFTRLEQLTYYYQDRMTPLGTPSVILAQTRALFAVLLVLKERNSPYLNAQVVSQWSQRRAEWVSVVPPRGEYAQMVSEYLRAIDTDLVSTLEAWMGERARTELALVRYTHDQETRTQGIESHITATKARLLETIQVGLANRAASQTVLQDQSLVWLGALSLLALAGTLILFWLLRMFQLGLVTPLVLATQWAARVREGDYSARLELQRGDELGDLSSALDHLALVVDQKTKEAETLNRELEQKVALRTDHLAQALHDLEDTQSKLVNSEKMAVLGTLAAGMAHELNTPLAAILSADQSILDFFWNRAQEVGEIYDGLGIEDRKAVGQVLMAATQVPTSPSRRLPRGEVGILVKALEGWGASDPRAQGDDWIELGLVERPDLQQALCQRPAAPQILKVAVEVLTLWRLAQVVHVAGLQASRVVDSLRPYMVKDQEEAVSEFSLKEALQSVLDLMGAQRLRTVEVHWGFGADFVIRAPRMIFRQVWLNLTTNALEAMSYKGRLSFEAEASWSGWAIRLGDTGTGIPPEVASRIFEPFFSLNKERGGMGLGLDLCRRLIEGLGGKIGFTSSPGNTVFEVWWPRPPTGG